MAWSSFVASMSISERIINLCLQTDELLSFDVFNLDAWCMRTRPLGFGMAFLRLEIGLPLICEMFRFRAAAPLLAMSNLLVTTLLTPPLEFSFIKDKSVLSLTKLCASFVRTSVNKLCCLANVKSLTWLCESCFYNIVPICIVKNEL